MTIHVGPRTISAIGGSIKRVGNYRIHTFPSELVTDGLVLNLDAGDPRSYSGSGTTWTDLSGYNQTGAPQNGPTYNNANGGSFTFSKAGLKYIESTASAFNITGANAKFTLEAWAKNTTDGTYNTVLSIATRYAQIGFHANATFMYGANGGSGNNLIFPGGHTVGNWYHLVMTFEGLGDNIAKFYVNGSLLSSGNIGNNGNTTTTSIRIGAFATSGTEFLDGNVAIARVYNKALSAAEVAQNYDALKVRYTSYTNTFTPLCGGGSGKVEVLCVAGGGGGGNYFGGGGGAGGLLYNSAFTINSNVAIGVTVGAGGTGGFGNSNLSVYTSGTVGGNSIFSGLISYGGGVGNGYDTGGTQNGGSGGGGRIYNGTGGTGISGQGNSGGRGTHSNTTFPDDSRVGGGGGGAGGPGGISTVSSIQRGCGGPGLTYSISGNSLTYAGGGAGTGDSTGIPGSGIGGAGGANVGGNAYPNTGSGGGGSGNQTSSQGGNGSNGIVIVRYPATDYNVELLIVGGGGGGGASGGASGGAGGGGGAGGLLYYSSYPVSAGTKYLVTVGPGGTGATYTGNSNNDYGRSGSNSSLAALVAYGGGGGGGGYNSGYTLTLSAGKSGGSGGGAGSNAGVNLGGYGITGQGNNGGSGADGSGADGAGGGGGAGAVGQDGTGATATSYGGNGGIGLLYSITGISSYYAGGGGGGGQASNGTGGLGGGANAGSPGGNGTANTGGGGGGAQYAAGNVNGGNGGSGIIIIAYQGPQRGIGGTVDTTSRPGYTLHRFTTTGTDFFIP